MRNNLLLIPVTAVLLLLSLAGSSYAHHATASFDMTQSTTVKGTVTSTGPIPMLTFIST
jgi:hypothetical protein